MHGQKGVLKMKSAAITFRMDEELKQQTERILDDIGLTMSSAFTVFAKAIVRTRSIPFKLCSDPFYNAENRAEIDRRIDRVEAGTANLKTVSMDELDAMTHG